ncbi:MAG: helix-turn-helix transcriptional regulator [Clostridia bacterium]|nr:helix-turn-helix transcriptional regulator [Clostridia bacterium]
MIRKHKLKSKLTQQQLAKKLDISWRHLQRLEYEEGKTTIKTLKKIIKLLAIPYKEIISYLKK